MEKQQPAPLPLHLKSQELPHVINRAEFATVMNYRVAIGANWLQVVNWIDLVLGLDLGKRTAEVDVDETHKFGTVGQPKIEIAGGALCPVCLNAKAARFPATLVGVYRYRFHRSFDQSRCIEFLG